ncbi:HisA/HisF-related TIM barrel protein [Qipengyuania sediminis]|uniref:HisA/HisF-related TIM barrel protein n=1 Tax=Qipengyuania sediminis TaxID=1532023 RepID=UPI00105A0747|nr:HisA/HisF-related TIM barrel protein [Qipengyuania sediminis]
MLRTRIIPCLQLRHGSLVKTRRFGRFEYIGDPANTCRIFNECEVDELAIVDIAASTEGRGPDFQVLEELADECFMPVAYGGGITRVEEAERVLRLGMEKIIIGTAAYERPGLISEIANAFGSQCVIAAIDVAGAQGRWQCRSRSARQAQRVPPVDWARRVADAGAGEILLTSIDREGTWTGFDQPLIAAVSAAVGIPVIAHGGAGRDADIMEAVDQSGASAVALGSMVVFQKRGMGVLVNFPEHLTEWSARAGRQEAAYSAPADRP